MIDSNLAFHRAVAIKLCRPLATHKEIAVSVGRDYSTVCRWFRELKLLGSLDEAASTQSGSASDA